MKSWRTFAGTTLALMLMLPNIFPVWGTTGPSPASRIKLAVRAQLDAMIQYTRGKQAAAPIPAWIDESHHACVGVGIEETLTCEIEVLQSHCKSQTSLSQESCLSLADHYASLYMNRKAFADWRSLDFSEKLTQHFTRDAREFHLERLRNRFVALRKVLETLTPPCRVPWTAECEIERLTRFCTEYAAQTAFPWAACVGGVLESWRI